MFTDPASVRRSILEWWPRVGRPLSENGAHLYAHLTGYCPVICRHCMYGSNTSTPASNASLDGADIEQLIDFAKDSRSVKFTISGGGEPFGALSQLLSLVGRTPIPEIEIDTAGNWAVSADRAEHLIDKVCQYRHQNSALRRLIIRVSADMFHLTAKRPVPLEAYAWIVSAWLRRPQDFDLAFRGLLVDGDETPQILATLLGGTLKDIDKWNRRILLKGGVSIPFAFNVLRFSGAGHSLHGSYAAKTGSFVDYFENFERHSGGLRLSGSINHAVDGHYQYMDGLSLTVDFDGRIFIYGGSAPDIAPNLRNYTFSEAVACFGRDPITHVLLHNGLDWLASQLRPFIPHVVDSAFATNSVISFLDTLLADDRVRLFATIVSGQKMLASFDTTSNADHWVYRLMQLEPDQLARDILLSPSIMLWQ